MATASNPRDPPYAPDDSDQAPHSWAVLPFWDSRWKNSDANRHRGRSRFCERKRNTGADRRNNLGVFIAFRENGRRRTRPSSAFR